MPKKLSNILGGALFTALAFLTVFAAGCNKSGSAPGSAASVQKEENELLNWNLKTLVDAYDTAGFTNVLWDIEARKCLTELAHSRAGDLGSDEPYDDIIGTNAAAAIDEGCKDPMVRYVFIRFAMDRNSTKEAFADSLYKNAKDMYNSAYPAVRKFYPLERAAEQLYSLDSNTNDPRIQELLVILMDVVPDALSDKTMPAKEAGEVAKSILYLTSGSAENEKFFYDRVEQMMSKNWPNDYPTYYMKGNYYINQAWSARGFGGVETVTAEGQAGFSDNIVLAREAFEHAWKLDSHQPEIAEQMMTVVKDQGGARDQWDLWFSRAMDVSTNDYEACQRKLSFLGPDWNGSIEDQLSFGRECVASKKWGGRVPLILVDAHLSVNSRNPPAEQADYWKKTEVWQDVESAYERFFELNPNATGYYHNYAWYAYHAEDWDKLNELIPKLGPINYNYFGGKAEFDKMVSLAKEHAK